MKTIQALLVSLACLTLFSGCDIIDYHPYDANFSGTRDINNTNIARIESEMAGRDSLRFAVISDTQRWYDETADAVSNINARGDIDFVIHCGDLTDFGATNEFEWMRDELEKLQPPYVCLIGNHDCLANGVNVFEAMFGARNFSFTAGNTHFICLDTNALEHDYSVPIPNFDFIQADLDSLSDNVTRTVVAVHAAPGTDQFNNNVADFFQETIRKFPSLQFCLCGHEHATAILEPFDDGIYYYECTCAKKREYLVFTLTSEGGVGYEVVSY